MTVLRASTPKGASWLLVCADAATTTLAHLSHLLYTLLTTFPVLLTPMRFAHPGTPPSRTHADDGAVRRGKLALLPAFATSSSGEHELLPDDLTHTTTRQHG